MFIQHPDLADTIPEELKETTCAHDYREYQMFSSTEIRCSKCHEVKK